jgi:hypothetical protein
VPDGPTRIEDESALLPRWVQIPAGLLLGLLTLLCLTGLAAIIFSPHNNSPVMAPMIGLLFVAASVWILEMCVRLIIGRRKQGGLMSPTALRAVGWLFGLLPVAGIFTGYYRAHPLISPIQVVVNISIFISLQRLAVVRERVSSEQSNNDRGGERASR